MLCDTATVTITLAPMNDAPAALNDSFLVSEDVLTTLNILANDSGVGDQPLSVTIVSPPSSGLASVIGSPGTPATIRIEYTSSLNYNGPDSLRYRVTDLDGEVSEADVSITVTAVNDPPVAAADNGYVVTEDTSLDTALLPVPPPPNRSVLANDSDVDCTPPATDCNPSLAGINLLSAWTAVVQPPNGTVLMRADGTFVYTPRPNFFGVDIFSYWAFDGSLFSAATTVRITVINEPGDIPDARDDAYTISEDTATVFPVLANDLSVVDIPVSVTILAGPAHGAALVQVINGTIIPPDIRIWYSPALNQNSVMWGGPDLLTYQVCDNDGECDTAVVRISVEAVHDPPTTFADAYTIAEDQIASDLLPSVLANDLPGDAAISPSTVCIVGRPCPPVFFPISLPHGDITDIDPFTGIIEYQPDANYFGLETFQYTVEDMTGARSAAATVTITITPENDTPSAVDDQGQTVFGLAVNVSVLLNDLGIGDIPLTLSVVAPIPAASDGVCAPLGGQIRFTPGPGFSGTVQCGYRVTDADLEFDEAVITIYVNMPPTAVDDPTPSLAPRSSPTKTSMS